MINEIFPKKLYVPNHLTSLTPQKGPGNKKIISYELTLVSKCLSEKEFRQLEALYKVQGIHTLDRYNSNYNSKNIYEQTSDILISSPLNGGFFTLIYPNDIVHDGYHTYNFYAHYEISGKGVANPNCHSIKLKRDKALALNKRITDESELIATYSKSVIWLDRDYVKKLLENELKKYGKSLSPYTKIVL